MKNLYALHSVIAILFCATAQARVVLVEDSSPSDRVHMARVISKTPIVEKVPYMITKQFCEKHHQTTHYYGTDRNSPIVATLSGKPNLICKDVITQDFHNVIKGYQVTYEYKGTIKYGKLNYEPGEFVQVYNAP